VSAAQVRILIYGSDSDGWPDALIWDSGALSAATTNSYVEGTSLIPSLTKGTLYWLGALSSANATLRCIAATSTVQIGGIGTTSTAATYGGVVRRTGLTFAAPPNPWGFAASQITAAAAGSALPPQILARFA
jgi:hypothetical protein